jgi:hypothetical protein
MKLTIDSHFSKREQLLPNGNKLLLLDVLGKEEDIYSKEEQNRNVFLLTPDGKIIWRVAYHEGARGHDPFTNLYFERGKLVGCTWEGWSFELGLEDGSLTKLGWSK